MNPPPNPLRATRRQSLLCLLVAGGGCLLALDAASAQTPTPTPELYFRASDTAGGPLTERRLDATSPAPTPRGRLPVLFVHGHDLLFPNDTFRNYRKNWQERGNSLPSFMEALDLGDNDGLGIEDYYMRFRTQGRSIAADAAEISAAVERILHRHDPGYPARGVTAVQVVIIAYSKGTISTRLYLKNLDVEGRSFRPVSEFIAISPPNHGLNSEYGGTTCAGQQLMNGLDASCAALSPVASCSPFPDDALGFFRVLNGHPANDTLDLDETGAFATEAPGSRPDLRQDGTPNPPAAGTLYVTLFADGNRDFVGGLTPSGDCRGRKLAKNLSGDAINVEVPEIPGGNVPALVHANSVHTPEVICKALYTAVHHRSPEQTPAVQCTPVGDVPVIPPPPPPPRAAAVLALDFSGSMSARACPGCPTRAAVLEDAVTLFVQLWSTVSVPSDLIGLNYFGTNVTPSAVNGGAPVLPTDRANDVIADVIAQTPGGSTAMGGGLQHAIQMLNGLSVDTRIRRVILFTDGLQNVNPMVLERINPMIPTNRELVIDNDPGRPNSNISATMPPTILNTAGGIAVDTIGIGDDAALVGLLSDIAADTGGHTLVTSTPGHDLRRFFVERLITALRGFSPQLVGYRRASIGGAGSSIETFVVEGGPRRVVLKLSWERGETMDFSVRKDGVDVTAAGRFISGEFYKIFFIDLPKKGKSPIAARGNWQVLVKGKATTAYEAAAIVDGGRITYDAVFKAKRPTVGSPFDLVVQSTAGGKPLAANARVTATLMIPTTTARDLIAANPPKEPPVFEPGMTLVERQLLALEQDPRARAKLKPRRQTVVLKRNGNGAYSTRLRPRVPGIYTAVVTIEGEAARIGKFSRTMTATTVVRTPEPRK
jgi:hypothetical protein